MKKSEEAAALGRQIAADDSHGYDQAHRWGPDFDCSSLIIWIWQEIGVPVRDAGASYTGDMRGAFLRCGFSDVSGSVNLQTGRGMQAGDVLINYAHHAAMSLGGGQLLQARINEKGTATGGQPGDQTGQEIAARSSYYNYPWDCCLRYTRDAGSDPTPAPAPEPTVNYELPLPLLQRGSTRTETVRAVQQMLIARGFTCGGWGDDGQFGRGTEQSVRNYQTECGLEVDGEVGGETWASLLGI